MTTLRVPGDLDRLRVHISIDDFGTGHSSPSYLRTLPADQLKIDRSVVLDLQTSEGARKVALAVVNPAKAPNLRVVAEGAEAEGQNRILRETGCDQLQGYLFAKPISAKAIALRATEDEGPRAMNLRASICRDSGKRGSGGVKTVAHLSFDLASSIIPDECSDKASRFNAA